jgi:flagellar hook-associated protein 2
MVNAIVPGFNTDYQAMYRALIQTAMIPDQKRIQALSQERSALNARMDVYRTLENRVSSLDVALGRLYQSDSAFGSRAVSVTGKSQADAAILTATASRSAIPSSYSITVSSLAQAQRVVSDKQISTTTALGLQGEFYVGGDALRSAGASTAVPGTVSGFGVNTAADAIATGTRELGAGTYHVEVRDEKNVLQFRIVDQWGQAVSVRNSQEGATGMTADWQNLGQVSGTTFDTGLGLTVDFADIVDHGVSDVLAVADTVDGFATGAVRAGQTALASGAYHVEVREDAEAGWQFRLVNDAGEAQSVYDAGANNGSFTAGWQSIDAASALDSTGRFSTGRGLTIDFGAGVEGEYTAGTGGDGAASVQYTAREVQLGTRGQGAASVTYMPQGARVRVTSDQSLADIARSINQATYAAGAGVSASVVDGRLVLTAATANRAIRIGEVSGTVLSGTGSQGLGLITGADIFRNTAAEQGYRAYSAAVLTVDGITIERDRNDGLTDVISGLTLNLAADAAGKSATLNVTRDNGAVISRLEEFVSRFNGLQAFIKVNTAISPTGTGTYTRSQLSGDTILRSTRTGLYGVFNQVHSGLPAGAPDRLEAIGITIDRNLEVSISDRARLEAALAENPGGVEALCEKVMTALKSALQPYLGAESVVKRSITSLGDQVRRMTEREQRINQQMEQRQAYLEKQYAAVQVQLASMQYESKRLGYSFWGTSM